MQTKRDAGQDLFKCMRFFQQEFDPDRAIAIAEFAPYWINRAVEAEKDAERLREERDKLVEALRWYAEERPHEGSIVTAALNDRGQRARDTLKELGLEG